MGRKPCCAKVGLNRGAWLAREDRILINYIEANGEGQWRDLPQKAGLKRCGKSCRLRWLNYLRPNIKRGNISEEEDDLIARLHKLLGNRWSLIAGRLPGRTDNEIKNYWNTTLSKKLESRIMGLDQSSSGQRKLQPSNNQISSKLRSTPNAKKKKKKSSPDHDSDQPQKQLVAVTTSSSNIRRHEVIRTKAVRCTKPLIIPNYRELTNQHHHHHQNLNHSLNTTVSPNSRSNDCDNQNAVGESEKYRNCFVPSYWNNTTATVTPTSDQSPADSYISSKSNTPPLNHDDDHPSEVPFNFLMDFDIDELLNQDTMLLIDNTNSAGSDHDDAFKDHCGNAFVEDDDDDHYYKNINEFNLSAISDLLACDQSKDDDDPVDFKALASFLNSDNEEEA